MVDGKVFLLIRVNEGGAPPYTPKKDPTVYMRTGNITTPLGPADTEIVRELYAKRTNAEGVRKANVARSKAVLLSMLEQGDLRRGEQMLHSEEPDGSKRFLLSELDDDFPMLTAYLQPFYPGRELAEPREMYAALADVRVLNRREQGRAFPAESGIRPMARGMLVVNFMGKNDLSFSADQVYATGFFSHSEHSGRGVRGDEAEKLFLPDIARVLYTTLRFGRKLYNRFGYSGLTQGAVALTGAKGRPVRLILAEQQWQAQYSLAIDAAYRWLIEADTHQLSDDAWVREYFYRTMREIYWDLGVEDVDEQTFDTFLDGWHFT